MKYAIIILLFSVLSCKNETKANSIAKTETVTPQTVTLEVYDYSGLEAFLNNQSDKTYIVNFWATWCAPCIKELPFFEEIGEKYKANNVEVVLVSLDFPRQYDSKLKPFIAERKLKSKVVALNDVDTNTWIPKVDEEWTGAIPATLIYNKDMRQFYEQSFSYEELETQLKQFLK